jgi:hypothetical protein
MATASAASAPAAFNRPPVTDRQHVPAGGEEGDRGCAHVREVQRARPRSCSHRRDDLRRAEPGIHKRPPRCVRKSRRSGALRCGARRARTVDLLACKVGLTRCLSCSCVQALPRRAGVRQGVCSSTRLALCGSGVGRSRSPVRDAHGALQEQPAVRRPMRLAGHPLVSEASAGRAGDRHRRESMMYVVVRPRGRPDRSTSSSRAAAPPRRCRRATRPALRQPHRDGGAAGDRHRGALRPRGRSARRPRQ